MSHFLPTKKSPWVVIFYCVRRKEWRPTARLHEKREYARAYAKTYTEKTRVVRAWIPLK